MQAGEVQFAKYESEVHIGTKQFGNSNRKITIRNITSEIKTELLKPGHTSWKIQAVNNRENTIREMQVKSTN